MSDPIADDKVLLYTWTRIIIALIALLAFAVGANIEIPIL